MIKMKLPQPPDACKGHSLSQGVQWTPIPWRLALGESCALRNGKKRTGGSKCHGMVASPVDSKNVFEFLGLGLKDVVLSVRKN